MTTTEMPPCICRDPIHGSSVCHRKLRPHRRKCSFCIDFHAQVAAQPEKEQT